MKAIINILSFTTIILLIVLFCHLIKAVKMKKRKLKIFISIISLLLFFGMVCNLIMMSIAEKHSEENTTEFAATVINVELKGTGTRQNGIIYTEEYGDKLNIFDIKKVIDMNDFNSLQTGQTVFFRIDNIWLDQFEEMEFIYLVSLKTADKEMISLSNYNEYMDHQRSLATITGIIGGLIFLLTFIHCVLLFRGFNVFRRFKDWRGLRFVVPTKSQKGL